MKLFTKLFFIFFFLISYASGHSQIQIGEGTDEYQSLPIDPYFNYSYTQSIYLQPEINSSGTITSIQYYYSGTSNLDKSDDNIQIWMAHTTKTAFSNTTDWEPISAMTQVFNGSIPAPTTPGTDEWITITLTTPFTYDNTNNLIIAVDANELSSNGVDDDFHCTSVIRNRSIYKINDYQNPDPTNPPPGSPVSYIPNIILGDLQPMFPCAASSIPSSGETVPIKCGGVVETSWIVTNPQGAIQSYDVYLGTTSGSLVLQGNTTNKNYTFTGLGAGTYFWKVIPKNDQESATGCPEWSFVLDESNSLDAGTGDEEFSYKNSYATGGPVYNWIDPISGNHTEITTMTSGDDDNGYFHVTDMGISFNYFGSEIYTDCYIGTNGFVSFGQGFVDNGASSTIPSAWSPNKMIAGCMMNLDDGTNGKIYYAKVGTNFVITWYKYHDYLDENEYITFQIILEGDADGGFTIQYNETESSANIPDILIDAVIGAEFSSTTAVVYRSNGLGGPIFCSPLAVGFSKAPLPVELLTFEGRAMEKSNKLEWVTATEENTEWHIIERSDDGRIDWHEIGRTEARGSSRQQVSYELLDSAPKMNAYYRLKSLDYDGYTEYSDIILIRRQSASKDISVFPNPTNGLVIIEFESEDAYPIRLELTDITGKIVQSVEFNAIKGLNNHKVDMSDFSNGVYFISMDNGIEKVVERVMKF